MVVNGERAGLDCSPGADRCSTTIGPTRSPRRTIAGVTSRPSGPRSSTARRTTSTTSPSLQFFQNILMNGGVCGRRAFFGRFILRAFGIPTTARPQPGHAALVHWTPDGWVICLGGRLGQRLGQWDATGRRLPGEHAGAGSRQAVHAGQACPVDRRRPGRAANLRLCTPATPAFWNGVALYTQRADHRRGQGQGAGRRRHGHRRGERIQGKGSHQSTWP